MKFTEQDLINAFRGLANEDDGWIYLTGVPTSNAKLVIDYMKKYHEPIDEVDIDELVNKEYPITEDNPTGDYSEYQHELELQEAFKKGIEKGNRLWEIYSKTI